MSLKSSSYVTLPQSESSTSLIHGPYWPADVRNGENISIILARGESGERTEKECQVWRLSPLGAEVVAPTDERFAPGERLDARLRVGNQLCRFSGLVIAARYRENSRTLLGLRWCQESEQARLGEGRENPRWLCGDGFLPTGVAANPVRFNDFIHFRVVDCSSGGLKLITSLRNKFLIPGMRLDVSLSFPMVGQTRAHLAIAWTKIVLDQGRDALALGVSFIKPNAELLELVGQYLLQFAPVATVSDLRKSGLIIRSAARAMDFSYVRTEEEYQSVLKLRKMAYSAVGKVDDEVSAETMGDVFDTRARILIAKYRGEIVGSLRLIYHTPEDQLEQEEYVTLSNRYPRRDEMVEVTRVCTHPDFRRSDLLLALMKQVAITILQSGRRWMIGCATDSLISIYERVGCVRMPERYKHEALGGEEHTVILMDLHRCITGQDVNPLVWNYIYPELLAYVTEHGLVEFTTAMNVRIAAYRALKPISDLAFARNVRKMKDKPRKAGPKAN